jgi:hypothetical protein
MRNVYSLLLASLLLASSAVTSAGQAGATPLLASELTQSSESQAARDDVVIDAAQLDTASPAQTIQEVDASATVREALTDPATTPVVLPANRYRPSDDNS